ncbi:MAG: UbiA family prenyltransferase [Actinomycetes bacterium]
MIRALVRASHFPPTVAVTTIATAYAASLGWRGVGLLQVLFTVLFSQLSVGWSNDAFDAPLDAQSGRKDKPTAVGAIAPRILWRAAVLAAAGSALLSWRLAGWLGCAIAVGATAVAWLYNVALSRTIWSWLPYAIAFGLIPTFLTYGLEHRAPATWIIAVFSIFGVSAHLANALPDLDSDRSAGRSGICVRLGAKRTSFTCWSLLGIGSVILALQTRHVTGLLPGFVGAGYLGAFAYGKRSTRRQAAFQALLAAFALDAIVFAIAVRHR